MFILVLILKWPYASLVGAEAGEVKFSPNFKNAKRALAQWLGMRLCSLMTRVQFLELTGDAQGVFPIY